MARHSCRYVVLYAGARPPRFLTTSWIACLTNRTSAASVVSNERCSACSAALATFAPETRPVEELPAGTRIVRHRAVLVVDFASPPEAIFASLLADADTPLPQPEYDRYSMVVAPGLLKLCRLATAAEVDLWDNCSSPVSVAWLCQSDNMLEGRRSGLVGVGCILLLRFGR